MSSGDKELDDQAKQARDIGDVEKHNHGIDNLIGLFRREEIIEERHQLELHMLMKLLDKVPGNSIELKIAKSHVKGLHMISMIAHGHAIKNQAAYAQLLKEQPA